MARKKIKRRRTFEYHPEGMEVEYANLIVLNIVRMSHTMQNTKYEVRLNCCGKTVIYSHATIKYREDSGRKKELAGKPKILCSSCQMRVNSHVWHKKRIENKRLEQLEYWRKNSRFPSWPVPPLVLKNLGDPDWEPR